MIDGVANHVQQRFEEGVDDRLVGFGVIAFGDELDRLAQPHDHLAHQPRKPLEDVAQRQHADVQHRTLQVADQPVEHRVLILQQAGEGGSVHPALRQGGGMAERVLGHDQFAGQVHQRVDPLHVDPQGPRGGLGRRTAPLGLARVRDVGGFAGQEPAG